jgi:hypothetical protein
VLVAVAVDWQGCGGALEDRRQGVHQLFRNGDRKPVRSFADLGAAIAYARVQDGWEAPRAALPNPRRH